LQFSIYDSEQKSFYSKHTDVSTINDGYIRKLSFTIHLNDSSEYAGGNLIFHISESPNIINKQVGVGTFFPSHMLHEVTPVTSGIRYSLVGWCRGYPLK